ncbi:DUF3793 family protein [Anaerophilus nitritogenes]|uniref:DUF3793 family protein n=1 Tax=Anaerophilus nitritogenes TaxID=2498136 RepID=UPI0013EA6217|nr:DUF3793 family protein [Anaerophilus nitritogenes]
MCQQNYFSCLKNNKDPFIQWLLQTLGPVMLGKKPSEILSFSREYPNTSEKLKKINSFFQCCKKLSYKVVGYGKKSIKVFFYHPGSLQEALTDPRNKRFLNNIGYPKNVNVEEYVLHMTKKIEAGMIPDEIGIFLGYPLKDVLGFMGHPSLKLTKVKGWRIYGDTTISEKRYDEFVKAKDYIKTLLSGGLIDQILSYA